jgi:hypothetical protein
MRRKLLASLAVAAAAALVPSVVRAADPRSPARNISGTAGVTFATAYVSRGLVLENQGVVAQPYAELDFKLYEGKTGIQKMTAIGGIWNSLHSEHTDQQGDSGANSTTDIWYEFDWYTGVGVDFLDKWNMTLIYQEFTSPNDGFGTVKNLQLTTSYNDAGMWSFISKDFSLKPYVRIFVELEGKAGSGADQGEYFELGIAPSLPSFGPSDYPITVSFPINVGLGADDFYGDKDNRRNNETFGYASIGVVASVPLKFMADNGWGSWTWSVGGTYYYLSDGLASFNDGNVKGDSHSQWVAFTGLSFSF